MDLRILDISLLKEFRSAVRESPFEKADRIAKPNTPIDYFEFYKSVSSVYSSKIEGEEIDFDSYFKHKFLNVKFNPHYMQKADDLYSAYEIIDNHEFTLENVRKAHSILSSGLLPKSQQGLVRTNPMFVLNSDDEIEFVAASPEIVKQELSKLFHDITLLRNAELDPFEIFYFAAFIHLVFVKIHPFQDGNGRTGRLIEKWFLIEMMGQRAAAIQLERNYFKKLSDYYSNIRKLGLEYEDLDYEKSLDFLLMTISGIDEQA